MMGGAIKTNEEKMIEATLESCFFKSFMACVLGKSLLIWCLILGDVIVAYLTNQILLPVFIQVMVWALPLASLARRSIRILPLPVWWKNSKRPEKCSAI